MLRADLTIDPFIGLRKWVKEAQPLPFTPTANPDPRNHAKPQTPCRRKPLPSWRFGLSPVMRWFAIPDDLSTPCRPLQGSGGSYRVSSRRPLRGSPGRPRAGGRLLERRHFVGGRSRSLGGDLRGRVDRLDVSDAWRRVIGHARAAWSRAVRRKHRKPRKPLDWLTT